VREINLKEFDEICEIRKVLELLSVQWAINGITPERIKNMKDNLARAEERIKEQDWETFVDLDGEFHELLAQASGSDRLQSLIQTLRADMVRYRVKSLHQVDTAKVALEGHKKIMAAVLERNVSEAEKSVMEHLEQSKKYIKLLAFSKE